eukprot:6197903-Pleurochrysis_carterae.AAC.1
MQSGHHVPPNAARSRQTVAPGLAGRLSEPQPTHTVIVIHSVRNAPKCAAMPVAVSRLRWKLE